MSITPCNNKKICDDISQLESVLDSTLQRIFERAGDRIKPDEQANIQQQMATTKQLLERLRTHYETEVDSVVRSIPSALEPVSTPPSTANTASRLLQEKR